MLCPQCRRMVGKDGYCPMGHLARPELQMEPPKTAPPPLIGAPPQAPEPSAPPAPPPVEVDPYTPPGLGPSNPPPSTAATTQAPGPLPGAVPTGSPPMPPDQLFGTGPRTRRGRVARGIILALLAVTIAVAGFVVFGGSAGASDLKVEFVPGETHTYRIEITARGSAGNLDGGFSTNLAIGADLTQTTGAVDGDGNATINYTLKNFTFAEGGRRTTPPPGVGTAFSVKMRPDGSVVELDGGDPFGLEEINPAGQFVNPSNAGPLLPDEKIEPGGSWTVKASQSLPDIGKISVEAVNTLVERRRIAGNEAAVIRSIVKVPLDIRIGHDELVRQAEHDGEDAGGIPGNAAVTMVGNMTFNLTQTIFTANGLLQSSLGDMTMRGTMSIEGVGPTPLSIAFDLAFQITMLKTSTGQSA